VNIFDALVPKDFLEIGFSMKIVPGKDKDLQIYQPEFIFNVLRLHPV